MSDTDKPMTGMALSMLDAPTRGEATLRDLRRYAAGIKDHNDRELVQHAADMLDVALRALRPEGRDTLAAKFADRMMTELQTDLGVHHDEPFLRMSRLRLRELVEAIKGLLDERGPQSQLQSQEKK